MPLEGVRLRAVDERRRSLCHIPEYDEKFLKALGEIDAEHAEQVHRAGCPECGGALDCAHYPRNPRGALGEAAGSYERRSSFCCRVDGCRKRATPASLRFLGRKVYLATVVTLISAMLLGTTPARLARPSAVPGIDRRTLARWRAWL